MMHEPRCGTKRSLRSPPFGDSQRVRLALILLVCSLSGCSMAAGGAVGAVVLGAGVVASGCYDHVEVRVRDASGSTVCDAEVTATRGDERIELSPCYSAVLSAGRWKIQAQRGGRVAATELLIPEDRECGRYSQSIELWL